MINQVKKPASFIFIFLLALGLSISLQSILAAWVAPSATPPVNNVNPPINESLTDQAKLGGLSLGGALSVTGNAGVLGNAGIGTGSPNSSKGTDGYIDAKDIYLRDISKWASELGTGSNGDRLISTEVAYKLPANNNVTFAKPNNADYALIRMTGGGNGTDLDGGAEDSEFMNIFLDFDVLKTSGAHTWVGGNGDSYTANYTWKNQDFGIQVLKNSGDDTASIYFVNAHPQFDLINGGTQIRISNLLDSNIWSQAYFINYYSRGGAVDEIANYWGADGSNIFNVNSGNIAIGTTTPNSLLHLYQISGNNAEIDIQSVAGANKHWALYHDRTTDDLRIWSNTPATDKNILTITNEGKMGIGTTTPSKDLSVNGQIYSSGDICTSAGGGKCLSAASSGGSGRVVAGGWESYNNEYGSYDCGITWGGATCSVAKTITCQAGSTKRMTARDTSALMGSGSYMDWYFCITN